MLFLDLNSSCSSSTLLIVLVVVKNILKIIQIIGPIISIFSLIYTIILLIKNPDEKKYIKRIKNSLIALLLLFFIPVIVNVVVATLGDKTTFSDCWNNVNTSSINANISTSTYKEIGTSKSTSQLITDPTEYQRGTAKPTTSSNGNSSSSGNKAGEGNTKSNKVVFIGDSRTVQMYAYLNGTWSGANYSSGGVHEVGNDIYVAEGAKGLAWLKDVGIPVAKKYFVKGNAIVILMGVNDLSNADNYVNYINSNSSSWKSNGSSLYYVSVNPCQGTYSNLNSSITMFNSKLKSSLNSNVGWIDTNTVLINNGFNTTDGLHYDEATYKVIHDYIKKRV